MSDDQSIKALKAELAAELKRNELAIQAANLGTWDWNIETGEVLFNNLWSEMLGYAPHEVASNVEGWGELLHPDDVERTMKTLQDNLDGKTSAYVCDHRLKTKAGDWLWVQARGCVIEKDSDGAPLKHTGTMLDIHQAKAHEAGLLEDKKSLAELVSEKTQALSESQERLSTILRLAPEGILTTDGEGVIQMFNDGAEKLFGYSRQEVIGHHMDILIPSKLAQRHAKHLEQFSKSDEERISMSDRPDLQAIKKDGTLFSVRVSISKMNIGGETLLTAVINDMTEFLKNQKDMFQAKQDAVLANRAKTDFLANMSHELRTPLNAVIGYAQLIEHEIKGPINIPDYKEYASAIHTSGTHLLSIIQDILDISKIEAKKQELYEEEVDLAQVIKACHLMVRELAERTGVKLSLDTKNKPFKLFADEKSLKQIILNLLSNAIKFTPSGKTVSLDIYLDDGAVVFRVSDQGVGIAEDDLNKITLPFTQVKNAKYPKKTQEGTGLGLSIVSSYMELYKAKLDIKSELDLGTTITVTFPKDLTIQ